ncbi:MAG: NAD(P)H-dependent oxidoreductase subunit E, partial [Anaerovoracaceae bacterium]|nr:NAD(P)H-dependent oxidoreductase subunit E [Anaerovoracaceae bacterium]
MIIKTRDDLRSLRDKKHKEMALRLGEEFDAKDGGRMHILVCGVAGCQSAGSMAIYEDLRNRIDSNGLQSEIKLISTGCMGLCAQGPLMVTYPDGIMYTHVEASDVEEIWNSHVMGGHPVERLFATEADGTKVAHALKDHSFYSKQLKIALKNCGLIDPMDIEEYIGVDGYEALARCLNDMDPEDVIDTMKDAVLRGRGGAGFPLGVKWESAARELAPVKYICCNADEGDPGAFMDRSILEGDPHSILEAMAIAGYACGAKQGYIYVRAEYPVAVERLGIAIRQAHEYGLLGKNILGRPFDFDIDIRLGAGAFVCGEATALMASIEGKRGEPRPKPPRSTEKGLFDCPTVLNNVETFANVPQIILKGTDWFKAIGTERSNGTKVFALGGKIENTGLVEVPMGTTLREVVFDIGGGVPGHLSFKAAQTGGPSGGCITAEHLDTPMDFDSLTKLGTMMGSGGLIVMAEDSCMVDIAKFFLDFTVDESCGKC